MSKRIATILACLVAAMGVVAIASAGGKPVHQACFGVQWYGKSHTGISHGDVNVLAKYHRVCIVGRRGPKGPAGADGAAGATGATGATGLTGATGPIGPQGLMGLQGIPGLDGLPGPAGPIGETGATGPAGADGAQGPAGPAGPKGDTGDTGPAGPAGPAGPEGPAGPQGPAGLDGSTIVTVTQGGTSGQKTTTATCPAGKFAISGGFNAQGSVTASFRTADGTGWTVTQSSGNTDSLQVYAYCV